MNFFSFSWSCLFNYLLCFFQNNQFSTLDLFDDSDNSNLTTEKSRKRAYQSDEDDDDDDGLPVGSAHKKHRVQNMDNFLDDEADDDDDDDDPEISISEY